MAANPGVANDTGMADTGVDDIGVADTFVQRLARAVVHHRTYPATSSACTEAVALCADALRTPHRCVSLDLRILSDAIALGSRTLRQESPGVRDLARRLRQADVALVTIHGETSVHDLTWFCRELVRRDGQEAESETLADAIELRGVEGIHLTMFQRMEVLDVGAVNKGRRELVAHERRRMQMAAEGGSAVGHVYAGENGWVRLDPSMNLASVSLTELAVLVREPSTLAGMLQQLAEGDANHEPDADKVLAERFEELTSIFAALDPALIEPMFSRLAHAVLELDPDVRRWLLKKSILPGLLDGKMDGQVLRHFPDLDLADSLTLLLDLEIAAPEVLTMALDRLDLPPQRRTEMKPLLESKLRERGLAAAASMASGPENPAVALGDLAKRVLAVDAGGAKDFHEFAAFDLSLDEGTRATIADLNDEIEATDLCIERLRLLVHLLSLRPGQSPPEGMLDDVIGLLDELADAGHWSKLADWACRLRELAESHADERPESSGPILAMLAESFQRGMTDRLLALRAMGGEEMQRLARGVLEAYGPSAVPSLLADLQQEGSRERRRSLLQLMCDSAASLAPGLCERLDGLEWFTVRNVLRVLGFSGSGCEAVLADYLGHPEPRVAREAFQSLARLATPEAAALVARELDNASRELRGAAEESLWRFPGTLARAGALTAVADVTFARRRPRLVRRLLLRLAGGGTTDLGDTLAAIAPLRFRFWHPSQARLGLWAWAQRGQITE